MRFRFPPLLYAFHSNCAISHFASKSSFPLLLAPNFLYDWCPRPLFFSSWKYCSTCLVSSSPSLERCYPYQMEKAHFLSRPPDQNLIFQKKLFRFRFYHKLSSFLSFFRPNCIWSSEKHMVFSAFLNCSTIRTTIWIHFNPEQSPGLILISFYCSHEPLYEFFSSMIVSRARFLFHKASVTKLTKPIHHNNWASIRQNRLWLTLADKKTQWEFFYTFKAITYQIW